MTRRIRQLGVVFNFHDDEDKPQNWENFHKVVEAMGMMMEKRADGELVIYTGWTYDDNQEKYREMTEEELIR